jgi:hypothetical protein
MKNNEDFDAEEALRRALAIDPRNLDAWRLLLNLLEMRKHDPNAGLVRMIITRLEHRPIERALIEIGAQIVNSWL